MILAVLLDVLVELDLEVVRDGLVIDEGKDVVLVVGRVDGVSNDIRAFEEMRIEFIEGQRHRMDLTLDHLSRW